LIVASLAVFIAIVTAVALTGALFRPGPWYEALTKPEWTPPNWLFAPAWTVLYIMIAVAGWLAWRRAGGRVDPAVSMWALQLIFNAAWSWLFFGRHSMFVALIDIVAMLLCILAFIVINMTTNRWAAWLFVPYALWVSYAAALNLALWRLNPGAQ
jgi:tryptophan-rich sensory protein